MADLIDRDALMDDISASVEVVRRRDCEGHTLDSVAATAESR